MKHFSVLASLFVIAMFFTNCSPPAGIELASDDTLPNIIDNVDGDDSGSNPTPNPNPSPTPIPGGGGFTPGNKTSANIFFSGHSLLDYGVVTQVPEIAQSQSRTVKYNRQGVGGSPIRVRTRGNSPQNGNQFEGYSTGTNRTGSGMNIINELLNPQTLGGDRYDTLIITERHDSVSAFIYENTVKYLRHYHERMRAGSPNAQTYFYESWLSFKDNKLPEWYAYENQARKVWECSSARINHSLAAENRTDRIKNIPAARALTFLVQRATTTNVPGITGTNLTNTIDTLFTDDVHTTDIGSYYMALVVYAAVFERTPVGSSYPGSVTAQQAASLQAIAWEYMENYLSTYQEPTLAQCHTMVADVCSAFWNYDWEYANNPNNINGCRNTLNGNQSNSPIYYNSATDASFWYPAPGQ